MAIEESERSDATDFDEVLLDIVKDRTESAEDIQRKLERDARDAEAKRKAIPSQGTMKVAGNKNSGVSDVLVKSVRDMKTSLRENFEVSTPIKTDRTAHYHPEITDQNPKRKTTVLESKGSDVSDFEEVLMGIVKARAEGSAEETDEAYNAKLQVEVGMDAKAASKSWKNPTKDGISNEILAITKGQSAHSLTQGNDCVPHKVSLPSKTKTNYNDPPNEEISQGARDHEEEFSPLDVDQVAEDTDPVVGWTPPTTLSRSEPHRIEHEVGAFAVGPVGLRNDLETGISRPNLDASEEGNNAAAQSEAIASATLVNEEELYEAKPALEGFQALIHNKRFKYLIGAFLLLLLAVIIPVAVVIPRKKPPTIVIEANGTGLQCGTALTNQADYRGSINVTETGVPCQPWASQFPNTHPYTPDRFPDADLTENYCRNPNGDLRPWCIVNRIEFQETKYCNVPFCDGERSVDLSLCGTLNDHYQDDYRGKINVTLSGKQCQRWDAQEPHEHIETPERKPTAGLEANYCRNPNREAAAWCYTTDNNTRWEICDVPSCEVLYYNETASTTVNDEVSHKEEAVENNPAVCGSAVVRQAEYRGTINVTSSNRTCQRWDSQIPHEHTYTPAIKPNDGLDGNYCRNPDSGMKAWCYTTDPDKRWEDCDIPFCPSADLKQCGTYDWKQQDYIGAINVTKSGLTCQSWTEQSPHYHLHLPALFPEANLVGNACRNPTGVDERAWCYTTSPDVIFEYCDVPFCTTEEEREKSFVCGSRASHQTDYRGTIAVTESGIRCQPWASHLPHFHEQIPHPSLEENYCRNPDGEERAWCYTEDVTVRRELCNVTFCEDLENGEDVP